MKSKITNTIYKLVIFLPLLLYFGPRSYIAYDEGFYALQARWILNNNNWVIPVWWDQLILDRTIGIQFLIAKSQQILGQTSTVAHIPSTISAGFMLFITYKLHQELISKKDAIISTLILATTYIWIDFAHLATQDMLFACLVTLGVYSLAKCSHKYHFLYLIIFGIWIGLAFMMKTFLVAVPLLSLFPYVFKKRNLINTKYFWLGLLIGFLPFIIWSISINSYLDKNIIFLLIEKFNNLSSKNNFTNPFYYYLWNIPVNFLPWSIFAIFGIIFQFKIYQKRNYLLVYFPIFFILILSLFSTKTPYYVLPIASILSLNAFIGLRELLKIESLYLKILKVTSRIIPIIIIFTIVSYVLILRNLINLNFKEELFLIVALFISLLILIFIKENRQSNFIFISILITPYLLGCSFVQSGLLTDRSRNIRESIEYILNEESLNNKTINVIGVNSADENSMSKLIKISLLTPKLGGAIKGFKDLKKLEYAWITESQISDIKNDQYELISDDKNLRPWKLIQKKI